MYTNISFLHGLRKKRNIKSSFLLYIMLGKLPFVLGYGVYCQNGGSEKIFFQFLTSCKKCLDAGKLDLPQDEEDQPRLASIVPLVYACNLGRNVLCFHSKQRVVISKHRHHCNTVIYALRLYLSNSFKHLVT